MIVSKASSNRNCFDILFSPNILIEMKPIWGTIKQDLQKKLGPTTSLMDEISPPIYVVCGSLIVTYGKQ